MPFKLRPTAAADLLAAVPVHVVGLSTLGMKRTLPAPVIDPLLVTQLI